MIPLTLASASMVITSDLYLTPYFFFVPNGIMGFLIPYGFVPSPLSRLNPYWHNTFPDIIDDAENFGDFMILSMGICIIETISKEW